ncbi:hypothetical protein HDU79_004269 [Rhizoclosmatium sp. JEL0117]|nr:hypothetical protein HDU79_004269 [Rhizoclosmatium sp. JEL0117]
MLLPQLSRPFLLFLILLNIACRIHVSAVPLKYAQLSRIKRSDICQSVGAPIVAVGGTCLARGQSIPQCSYIQAGSVYMTMQVDGNVVVYQGDPTTASITPNTPLWTTSTNQPASAYSTKYRFDYQIDGNFVVYKGDTPILSGHTWTFAPAAKGSTHLCLLTNGGLVLVNGINVVGVVVDLGHRRDL